MDGESDRDRAPAELTAGEPMTIDFGDPEFWQDPYPIIETVRRSR